MRTSLVEYKHTIIDENTNSQRKYVLMRTYIVDKNGSYQTEYVR